MEVWRPESQRRKRARMEGVLLSDNVLTVINFTATGPLDFDISRVRVETLVSPWL